MFTTLSHLLKPTSHAPAWLLAARLALAVATTLFSPLALIPLLLTYIPDLLRLLPPAAPSTANLTPPSLALALALVSYFDQSFSDSLLQEGDYLVDFLIIFLCATLLIWGDKKRQRVLSIARGQL